MQNDKAHLVATVRAGLTSYNNQGFLWWSPEPGATFDAPTLITNFQAHVQNAGEQGCGYEASLEAWYRFLVDPEPPLTVTNQGGLVTLDPLNDDVLLQQRKDFLRADSLLSIIMLTDENDCSIADVGQNWIAAQASGGGGPFHLPRGTQACESDPNGACCRSCASTETAPPAGCNPKDSDPNCQMGDHDDSSDHLNLRCWNQLKRFGLDFLYPTRRYVDGLKNQQVPNRAGQLVPNPVFTDLSGGGKTRDPSLIFFATIVGVPWQDIATPESLTGGGLTYLTATELTNQGRWDWLVPQCAQVGAGGICDRWNLADDPDDPLMIESILPRSGTNPATNQALVPPSGGVFTPGGIPNGHEYNVLANNDLQFACIFELPSPRDCTSVPAGTGCDCDPEDGDPAAISSPLCQQGDGSFSANQRFAKGYPGTRHLEVAKDFGENSIVASICPKVTTPGDPAYGYNPAVDAIIDRLKEALNVKCINRPVSVKPDGTVQCAIIEVTSAANGCNCDPNANRSDVDPVLVGPVLKQLGQTGQCGPNNPNGTACDPVNFCMCTINPAVDQLQCKTQVALPTAQGWCYIDPLQEPDPNLAAQEQALVAECNPPRLLRFTGPDTPKGGSTTFIACLGAPVSAGGTTAPPAP
jgi:hypothetical protein